MQGEDGTMSESDADVKKHAAGRSRRDTWPPHLPPPPPLKLTFHRSNGPSALDLLALPAGMDHICMEIEVDSYRGAGEDAAESERREKQKVRARTSESVHDHDGPLVLHPHACGSPWWCVSVCPVSSIYLLFCCSRQFGLAIAFCLFCSWW
jgi:hypothetical protein